MYCKINNLKAKMKKNLSVIVYIRFFHHFLNFLKKDWSKQLLTFFLKCRNEEKLYDDVIFSDEGIAGLLGCYTLFESENCNKNNWKMYSKKFYSKLISCLGTGWEQKINKISSKISNLIQLLVSEMSHCSKTFSVDFLEFYWKDDIWRNLQTNSYRIRNSI